MISRAGLAVERRWGLISCLPAWKDRAICAAVLTSESKHAPCHCLFLQAVGGVLFPLALLWVWEERLRAREIRSWRRARAQQQHNAKQRRQQAEQLQGREQQQRKPGPLEAAGSGEGSQQQQQLRRRRAQGILQPQDSPTSQGSLVPQGTPSPQGSPGWRGASPPPLPQDLPLPVGSTALWFVLSSWLVWQLLEATLL